LLQIAQRPFSPISCLQAFLFAELVQYYYEIPPIQRLPIVGISEKATVYLVGLLYAIYRFPTSPIQPILGLVFGILYHANILGIQNFQFPEFIRKPIYKYIRPLITASPPTEVTNARNFVKSNRALFENPPDNAQHPQQLITQQELAAQTRARPRRRGPQQPIAMEPRRLRHQQRHQHNQTNGNSGQKSHEATEAALDEGEYENTTQTISQKGRKSVKVQERHKSVSDTNGSASISPPSQSLDSANIPFSQAGLSKDDFESNISTLLGMGFDRFKARQALDTTGNNLSDAIEQLAK